MENTNLVRVCLELYKKNVVVCDLESFREEFQRFSYILKILSMYNNSGNLNARLLINHMVIIHNMFGSFSSSVLLEKCPPKIEEQLYTVLDFMGQVPQDGLFDLPSGDTIGVLSWNKDKTLEELLQEEICRE